MADLPVRVSRHGASVETFEDGKVGYKRVYVGGGEAIAACAVPPATRVVYPAAPTRSWNHPKVRVEHVVPIHIGGHRRGRSICDPNTFYEVGETTVAEGFDPDTSSVDAGGIHLYPRYVGAQHWTPDRRG